MEIKFNLSGTEHKELVSYCNLNDLLVSEIVKKSFTTGFNIERYGLLGTDQVTERVVEKIVEKRVEIPVEVIKEVVKIEYVEVEKPVEVIKEVQVEKIVEVEKLIQGNSEIIETIKEVPVEVIREVEKIVEVPIEIIKEVIIEKEPDNEKIKALEQTLQKLRTQLIDKDKQINELENKITQVQNTQPTQVTYLRGSNLNNKLF